MIRPLITGLRARRRPVWLGSLNRTTPVGDQWGYDRGIPVDRWYIDRFLHEHRSAVTGRVLEVKDSGYTDRFGEAVTERGVLDVDATNPLASYVADLASGDGMPSDHFDCFILTQTLQYVFDLRAAVRQVHRILRPGGAVLVTLPAVSRVTASPLTDYWRFTPLVAARLFAECFEPQLVVVRGRGSVLSQVAFLHGMAIDELDPASIVIDDERFPLIVTVFATKRG